MLRRRLSSEEGFTLVELLVGISIGTVIMLALFTLVDQAAPSSQRIADRTAAAGRARGGAEQISASLRSAVCVPDPSGGTGLVPPLVSAGDNQVTFYVAQQTKDNAALPTLSALKRQIVYDPTAKTLVENNWSTDGSAAPAGVPATRQLVANVTPDGQANPGTASAFFGYFAGDTPDGSSGIPTPSITTAQLASVERVSFGFTITPKGNETQLPSADYFDDVTLRLPPQYANGGISGGPACQV